MPHRISISLLIHLPQMLRQNLHILTCCNSFSNLRIQLIERIATARLHIVVSVPFYAGDKENRKYGVCHEHLISAVSPAGAAGHHLVKIKIFSAVRNSHNKKHVSSRSVLLPFVICYYRHIYRLLQR